MVRQERGTPGKNLWRAGIKEESVKGGKGMDGGSWVGGCRCAASFCVVGGLGVGGQHWRWVLMMKLCVGVFVCVLVQFSVTWLWPIICDVWLMPTDHHTTKLPPSPVVSVRCRIPYFRRHACTLACRHVRRTLLHFTQSKTLRIFFFYFLSASSAALTEEKTHRILVYVHH